MARDGIDQAKHEMSGSEPACNDHGSAQGWFNNSVTHAHDEQQEERKGVTSCVKNSNNDEENLGSRVGAVPVLVVCRGG